MNLQESATFRKLYLSQSSGEQQNRDIFRNIKRLTHTDMADPRKYFITTDLTAQKEYSEVDLTCKHHLTGAMSLLHHTQTQETRSINTISHFRTQCSVHGCTLSRTEQFSEFPIDDFVITYCVPISLCLNIAQCRNGQTNEEHDHALLA